MDTEIGCFHLSGGLPKDQGERSVIAGNVLDRQFTADRPNRKWVADFTYIWTAEGWLYVAAVIDLFSRRVVGWSMSDTMFVHAAREGLGPNAGKPSTPGAGHHVPGCTGIDK